MVKLNEILDDLLIEGRTKNISRSKAVHFVKKNCSKSLRGTPIYRQVYDARYNYGIIKPQNFFRPPPRMDPVINMLVDFMPSWQRYPDRSKSISASYNSFRDDDEDAFRVFPVNSAKMGVTPFYDFGFVFGDEFGGNNDMVSHFIYDVIKQVYGEYNFSIKNDKYTRKDYSYIKEKLSNISYSMIEKHRVPTVKTRIERKLLDKVKPDEEIIDIYDSETFKRESQVDPDDEVIKTLDTTEENGEKILKVKTKRAKVRVKIDTKRNNYDIGHNSAKEIISIWNKYAPRAKTAWDFIETFMNPENRGLKLVSPSFQTSDNFEVWTSAPSVLVRNAKLDEFMRVLNDY